jgi:hypothetical protein
VSSPIFLSSELLVARLTDAIPANLVPSYSEDQGVFSKPSIGRQLPDKLAPLSAGATVSAQDRTSPAPSRLNAIMSFIILEKGIFLEA